MAKKIESINRNKSGKHGNDTSFTRNLERGKLDLEEGISLHEDIKYSCKSLGEFKEKFNKEIFNNLNEKFKIDKKIDMEKVETLISMTDKQISKYGNEQEKILKKYYKKREHVEGKGTEKYKEELINSLNALNDSNKELQKQKDFLTMLISTEIRKSLLSLPEDEAPKINFNIGKNSYKIIKCKKNKKINWKQEIKNAINNKDKEDEERLKYATENWTNDKDYDNFKNFAYNFILRPFNTNGELDGKTIQYYTNSIIDCIQQKDIIKDIREEYVYRVNKKRELDKLCDEIKEVENFMNEDKEGETKEKAKTEMLDIIANNSKQEDKINTLEALSFINYLKNKGGHEDIVEKYEKMLKNGQKINFNISTKTEELNCDTKFKKQEDFLEISRKILKFLGKSLSKDKEEALKNLFDDIKGKPSLKLTYSDPDKLRSILERNGFRLKDGIYNNGTTKIQWDSRVNNARKEIKTKQNLKEQLKALENQPIFKNKIRHIIIKETDERVTSIINTFENIFGIKLRNPGGTWDLSGTEVLKKMLTSLIEKINKGVKKDNEASDKNIKNEIQNWMEARSKDNYLSAGFGSALEYLIKSTHYKNLGISLDDVNEFKIFEELRDQIDLNGDKNTNDDHIGNDIEKNIADWKKIYDTINWYENGKKGIYDLDSIGNTSVYINVKKILCLKNLFECEDFTTNEKFDYVDTILKLEDTSDKIKSRKGEHDSILISIFGKNNVITTSESEDNEYKRKEKELLNTLNNENIVEDFINKLKKLGRIDDKQGEEIMKMQNLFQGNPVDVYIKNSIQEGTLKNSKYSALNYHKGIFNFAVIQAGILEIAVENGNGLNVLNYLGFFTNELNIKQDEEENLNDNPNFQNALKNLISCLYENKTGCFSDKYPDNDNWRKLNFQDNNIYINKKQGGKKEICIGKGRDKFRLVGICHGGFYRFQQYFKVEDHDKYEDYLG